MKSIIMFINYLRNKLSYRKKHHGNIFSDNVWMKWVWYRICTALFIIKEIQYDISPVNQLLRKGVKSASQQSHNWHTECKETALKGDGFLWCFTTLRVFCLGMGMSNQEKFRNLCHRLCVEDKCDVGSQIRVNIRISVMWPWQPTRNRHSGSKVGVTESPVAYWHR